MEQSQDLYITLNTLFWWEWSKRRRKEEKMF